VFGYIRIYKPQLRICEYETYRSVYCTLCRHLGRQMGIPSRLLLNYDYTFMTMLMIALGDGTPRFETGRCVINPLKKCGSCGGCDKAFDYTSALTGIMFYYKLRDSIADSSAGKRLLWRTLLPYASHLRKKAARLYPEEDALVSEYITRQFAAEKHARDTGEIIIDELCQPTADVISAFAVRLSENENDRMILRHFGYYLGRWIYMIDALDDLDRDLKDGSFNPLVLKFGLTPADAENRTDLWEDARCCGNDSLNMSISEAVKYYELLELGDFKPITDNIMYLGISEAQRIALFPPASKKRRRSDKNQINLGVEENE
jgi:hypothetical protein